MLFDVKPKTQDLGIMTDSQFSQLKQQSAGFSQETEDIGFATDKQFAQLKNKVQQPFQEMGKFSQEQFENLSANISGALGNQITVKNTPAPILQKAKGTNYDPWDKAQTKKIPDGKGAAGVLMTDKMIAVSRKEANSDEPILPYGTVLEIDGQRILVADIKHPRFHSEFQFDFARPHSGSKPIPELNRDFDFRIIELGKGRRDAREKAKNF